MGKARIDADIISRIIFGAFVDVDDEKRTMLTRCGLTHDDAFYVYKHRLGTKSGYLDSLKSKGNGFCLVSILANDRMFNKTIDFCAITAQMEFWVPTESVPFLVEMIGEACVSVLGERFEVPGLTDYAGNTVTRSATLYFGMPVVTEVQEHSPIGEAALCAVEVALNIGDNIAIASDYTLDLRMKVNDSDASPTLFENIPMNDFAIGNISVTRPLMQPNQGAMGTCNTSKAVTLSFSCFLYINDLGRALERLVAAYTAENKIILNETITATVTFPNGYTINNDMVCSDAKLSGTSTEKTVIAISLNPKPVYRAGV